MAAAACSSAPPLTKAESAKVVTTTLEGCDSAVNALTVNLSHATPVGVVRLARTAQEQCGTATSALINARLPGQIFEPCQYASLTGSSLGEAAESAADSMKPSDMVQLEDATEKAAGARQECEAAIT